jgi:branched-chain amino acid aminotransferase
MRMKDNAADPHRGGANVSLPNFAFFRGKVVPYGDAKVGIMTHTIHYGTGVFGGLRGFWNNEEQQLFVFRPADHFRRFMDSCKMICMELPYTAGDLQKGMMDLLRAEDFKTNCYIRPLAYFSDEIIGVRLHNLTAEAAIMAIPFGSYVDNEEGLHVTFSSWRRVDDNMIPARGKISGAYVNSALIKTDAQRAGFDEALVLNQDGHLSEGSAANTLIIRNGIAVTPPITDNILEGITRRTVLKLLREELNIEVVERPVDRTEVFLAEEAFFCGTGVQIAAITKVDHRAIGTGRIGRITAELRKLYFSVVQGRVPKYIEWCAPVYARAETAGRR